MHIHGPLRYSTPKHPECTWPPHPQHWSSASLCKAKSPHTLHLLIAAGAGLVPADSKPAALIVLDYCYFETSEKLLPTIALATDPSRGAVHRQAPATPIQSRICSLLSSAFHRGRFLSTNFGTTAAKSTPHYNHLATLQSQSAILFSSHRTCWYTIHALRHISSLQSLCTPKNSFAFDGQATWLAKSTICWLSPITKTVSTCPGILCSIRFCISISKASISAMLFVRHCSLSHTPWPNTKLPFSSKHT